MPSPFPGMNLERPRVWHGFHERFVPAMAEAIEAVLGPRYFVEIEENVYVRETPQAPPRLVGRPDVYPGEGAEPGLESSGAPTATMAGAPARVRIPAVDVEREGYLQVRSADDEEVITVVELLSPSNKKPGPDREQYLAKRGAMLVSPVNLVEIDLLRGGGPRMPWEDLPQCDYYVVVSRAEDRPNAGIWPVALRERLPVIPIPLRREDGDVTADLQAILHRVYDGAGYHKRIYAFDPDPPLPADHVAWAQSLIGASP